MTHLKRDAISLNARDKIPQEFSIVFSRNNCSASYCSKVTIILPKRIENISISLYTNVHSIIIHKSQRVRTTQVFLQLVNDEQNADYPYNGTVFIHKKEWSADTCYEMHGP